MKTMKLLLQVHRRRLGTLGETLAQAREAEQRRMQAESQREAALVQARSEREAVCRRVDEQLLAGPVDKSDLRAAQVAIRRAGDAVVAAQDTLETARKERIQAAEEREAAWRAYRHQAMRVEKFDNMAAQVEASVTHNDIPLDEAFG